VFNRRELARDLREILKGNKAKIEVPFLWKRIEIGRHVRSSSIETCRGGETTQLTPAKTSRGKVESRASVSEWNQGEKKKKQPGEKRR